MNVQTELRRAERAMEDTPIQGVLACMGILGRFPRNPGARRLLGAMDATQRAAVLHETDALCAAGHWVEALQVLAPIGHAHPSDPALAQAETRCLFSLGRFAEMPPRLERPLRAHPDHPALLATLGTARYRLGDAPAALPLLERAARARPDDPHVANHLGLVQRALGRLDAARQSFLAAATRGGGIVEAWSNLAQMVDFREAPELLAALDRSLAVPGLTRGQQELLAFARAKAAFDLDAADAAFQWLARANRLHRARHPHDGAGDRRRALDLARRHPATPLAAAPATPRVMLVVGMPRSGTTLVERILDAHPLFEGLGECPELAGTISRIDRGFPWKAEDLAILAGAYHGALKARRRSDAAFVVDKMPSNALVAGFALAALPDAQVVHVRRDPVATALSNLRTRFTESNEFAYDIADIADRFALTEECMALWRRAYPDRVHEVTLERLTAAPRAEIAGLLAALDLPEDEACLGFAGAAGDVRTASARQVRGPIAPQASSDWQRYAGHLGPLIDALKPVMEARSARP